MGRMLVVNSLSTSPLSSGQIAKLLGTYGMSEPQSRQASEPNSGVLSGPWSVTCLLFPQVQADPQDTPGRRSGRLLDLI